MGVFPLDIFFANARVSLPHTRGGVSNVLLYWGEQVLVFPTLVGVFLFQGLPFALPGRLPHTRGGVSPVCNFVCRPSLSSPHSWGCFHHRLRKLFEQYVFPTLVGVFLTARIPLAGVDGLPHTRGGVSGGFYKSVSRTWSSPHSWGCFQLPLLSSP